MLLSNSRLAVEPSKFDHDEINIHSSATQHYGRHTALRGMLAALGFTPLFTRVERLSTGLALTGGASAAGMGAAGMGAAGTGPTGMGTALGFTPLFSRVERLSTGLTLHPCFQPASPQLPIPTPLQKLALASRIGSRRVTNQETV